jgi:cysteine desulfurase
VTLRRTYLDDNAGAPLRPEARAAMVEALGDAGNASSVHAEGRAARRRIEEARASVAALVAADPRRVTFVSGGTEANASVLTPDVTVDGAAIHLDRLLVSATEHPSVLAGGRFPASTIETIPVDGEGRLRLDALRTRLAALNANGERALVSVMLANNETGAIQPVAEVAALAHGAGAVLHCDTVQGAGRVPVDIHGLGADFLTLSAHKIGGPQGAGAIVALSEAVTLLPLLKGGRQERGARAGTENVAAIAGFGAAAAAANRELASTARWAALRDRLAADLATNAPVTVFSAGVDRLPQTLCFGVDGMTAETLVIGLDLEGVAVSSGAACSSGKVGPSHVLAAMGIAPRLSRSAIRVSFGWETSENDLNTFLAAWNRVVGRIAAASGERAA